MKKKIALILLSILVMMSLFTGCQNQTSELVKEETTESKVEGIILDEVLKDLNVRDARAYNGIVASANPYATKMGLDVLERGGNAIDAAVAVSFTLGLVEANASGPGGYGTMMIHDAKSGKQAYLDFMGTAPAALTQEIYESYQSKSTDPDRTSGKAALIPGAVDGWLKALDMYGTMNISEILKPIIELSREGYEISPHQVAVIQDSYENLLKYNETAETFLNDGLPYEVGDIVKNENYARLLEKISKEGRDGFYKGEVAEAIAAAVQETGGLMTVEDLASYESKWREPIRTTYRGYEIITAAPPSAGGLPLLEALNIIENEDMSKIKPNSKEELQLLSEALKYAHADRYNLVGDPDYVEHDLDGLLSKEYAQYLYNNKINKEKASEDQAKAPYSEYESKDTTHLTIMDKEGNMVSMTNTISLYYGCTVVPKGYGFALNSATFNFSKPYEVNQVKGGNRARSTIAPTVVLKDGKTYMAIGSPGGGSIPAAILQVLINHIDYGMDIQEAINQPRIDQMNTKALIVEGHMPADVVESMVAYGHVVDKKANNDSFFGGIHAIVRDQESGEMHGGADPRRDGKALGY